MKKIKNKTKKDYLIRKEKRLKEKETELFSKELKLGQIADKMDDIANKMEKKKNELGSIKIEDKNHSMKKLFSNLIDLNPLRTLLVVLVVCIGILGLYFGSIYPESKNMIGFWFLFSSIIVIGMYMITYIVITRHNRFIVNRMKILKNKKGT